MIALTKDDNDEFDKNALYQFKKIYDVCLKPECDKHIFRMSKGRPSKNHYKFIEAIDERMKNINNLNILQKELKEMVIKI